MVKLLLAIFLGGSGIVQLVERRYAALARVLIAWIIQLACCIYVYKLIEKQGFDLSNINHSTSPEFDRQIIIIGLVYSAASIYIMIYHFSTIVHVIQENGSKK